MKRTRSNLKPPVKVSGGTYAYKGCGNEAGTPASEGNFEYTPFEEHMVDWIREPPWHFDGKTHRALNNCVHTKVKKWHRGITGDRGTPAGNTLLELRDYCPPYCFPYPPVRRLLNIDALAKEAWDNISVDLTQDIDLTVALCELLDIKSVVKDIFSPKVWTGIRSVIQAASGGYLTLKFFLEPLMRDVEELDRVLSNYESIVTKFMDDRKKLKRRRFYRGQDDKYSEPGINSQYRDDYVISENFAVCAYVTYDCDSLTEFRDKCKVFQDMLGLRLRPSDGWELIPWSFLWDWFFDVGEFLRQFEDSAFPVTTTVVGYQVMEQYNFSATRYRLQASQCGIPYKEDKIGGIESWSYSRYNSIPDCGNHFINRGQYGPHQQVLSLALLGSRGKR